jgi:phage shock protein E
MRLRTVTSLLAIVAAVALTTAACSSSSSSDGPAAAAQAGTQDTAPGVASAAKGREIGATVIDVRTPEEYDEIHVDGANLIDIRSGDFDTKIAELDPSGTYLVYCRSGNRSGQAVDRMRALGLTALDGGAVGDMASAGWSTKS